MRIESLGMGIAKAWNMHVAYIRLGRDTCVPHAYVRDVIELYRGTSIAVTHVRILYKTHCVKTHVSETTDTELTPWNET